jgi:hypothetical protein
MWRYDDSVEKPVDIVALGFDFWHEIGRADDALDPEEMRRPLGPDGCLYYVRFARAGGRELPTWVDSQGETNLEAAMATAQSKLPHRSPGTRQSPGVAQTSSDTTRHCESTILWSWIH